MLESSCGQFPTTSATSSVLSKLISFYDDDGDGYVTIPEFRSALLDKIPKCCASSCPVNKKSTDCNHIINTIYTNADSMPTDKFGNTM